jgi:hypothetical protein
MRRSALVAAAALIAAFALAGLPVPAGSESPSVTRDPQSAAFTSVIIPANAPAQRASGLSDASRRSDGYVTATDTFMEPGRAPRAPVSRPRVGQPATPPGKVVKKPPVVKAPRVVKAPKSRVSGYATFYNTGATAMRLPLGTVVRICGKGGCIRRTVTDYGPTTKSRIVDLYKPDFFAICGCPSWSGTTWVTVSIY